VSSVALLLGLLVVAYVGSSLMSGKGAGYRLPSGAEYLLLGAALGPYALGVVERSTLSSFQPLAVVGTAWITLVIGADFGFQKGRRVTLRGLVAGVLLALATALAVGFGVYALGSRFGLMPVKDLRVVAGGVALVACETTRHAVEWVVQRFRAQGALTQLVSDVTDSDDVVPIVGMAVIFPLVYPPEVTFHLSFVTWAEITAGLGIVLGGTAAALLRTEPRASEGWGVILGAALLGTGIAWRLGLAPQATTFALGLSLPALSRHGTELRAMLARTEQPVLLPTLLLAGADVELSEPWHFLAIAGVAIVARFAIRALVAPVLTGLSGAPIRSAPLLGAGLMPSGALSIAAGLAFAARFPGKVGGIILGVAVALALFGELVGPPSLRRALIRAGELAPDATATPLAIPEPEPTS
jgi:hypothetical protein